ACGNDLGGAKAVIIGDPRTQRTEALITGYARLVDRLGGRYLTAEDVGTTQADMDLIHTITPYVTGKSESLGGSGDPSPATAWGVFHGMRAVAEQLWGDPSLEGRHVAIAGVGKVGSALARPLAALGCRRGALRTRLRRERRGRDQHRRRARPRRLRPGACLEAGGDDPRHGAQRVRPGR